MIGQKLQMENISTIVNYDLYLSVNGIIIRITINDNAIQTNHYK